MTLLLPLHVAAARTVAAHLITRLKTVREALARHRRDLPQPRARHAQMRLTVLRPERASLVAQLVAPVAAPASLADAAPRHAIAHTARAAAAVAHTEPARRRQRREYKAERFHDARPASSKPLLRPLYMYYKLFWVLTLLSYFFGFKLLRLF